MPSKSEVLFGIDIVKQNVDNVETGKNGRREIQVLYYGLFGIVFGFNRVGRRKDGGAGV